MVPTCGWVGANSVVVFLTTTTLGWVVPTHPPTHSSVGGWVIFAVLSGVSGGFPPPTHSSVGGWVGGACGWVLSTCGWVGGSLFARTAFSSWESVSSCLGLSKPRMAKGENRRVRRSKTASSSWRCMDFSFGCLGIGCFNYRITDAVVSWSSNSSSREAERCSCNLPRTSRPNSMKSRAPLLWRSC